jgi:hypothetical protein
MASLEEVERAFSPIAEDTKQFARSNSFQIEKCARGNAGWELTRPYSLGGTVTLLLLYDESMGLGVGAVWQFPCPEMSLLYSHFRPIRPCELRPETAIEALKSELNQLEQVKFGYWTHISPLGPSA